MDYFTTKFELNAAQTAGAQAAGDSLNNQTLDIITGGLSAFSTVTSAIHERSGLKNQAEQSKTETMIAETQAKQEANIRRERLLKALAQNRARAGAAGLAPQSGTLQRGESMLVGETNRQLRTIDQEAQIAAISGRSRRRLLRSEASQAFSGGLARAGIGLLERRARRNQRGRVY